MHFSVRLPIYDPAVFQSKESSPRGDLDSSGASTTQASSPRLALPESAFSPKHLKSSKVTEGELNANWEMWDVIRTICDNNVRLTLSER